MANIILYFYDRARAIIELGAPIFTITELEVVQDIMRMKTRILNEDITQFSNLMEEVRTQMDSLEEKYK